MNFDYQDEVLTKLNNCITKDNHSILISGIEGSGKTYLANQFSNLLSKNGIESSVANVEPKVESLQEVMRLGYQTSKVLVVVVENLDLGVPKASYTILKFLEEPAQNVYVIITCRNMYKVPSTILSRCITIDVGHPNGQDISSYSREKDIRKFELYTKYSIWKIVKSFSDVDSIFKLNTSQLEYFEKFSELLKCKDSISNLIWNFTHYSDGQEIDYQLLFRYIIYNVDNNSIKKLCISCMNDISYARISPYSVFARFVLECKYGG